MSVAAPPRIRRLNWRLRLPLHREPHTCLSRCFQWALGGTGSPHFTQSSALGAAFGVQ